MSLISQKQLKNNKRKELVTEQEFLAKAEDYQVDINPNLSILSIEELAAQYAEVDRQSHLLKGKILIEARNRFQSDKEFGQWVSTHSLCVGSQQSRNRLMHLARFFEDRDMTGITITAAYEISSPGHQSKAVEVYKKVYGKNLPVKKVKELLVGSINREVEIKKIINKKKTPKEYESNVKQFAVDLVDNKMSGESDKFIFDVLQKAIKYLNQKKSYPSLLNNR